MRLLIFSDIHGMANALEKVLKRAEDFNPDKLVILGDILYHGPRNGVPDGYNPDRTVELLNAHANEILSVRGNCDCEVDQMLLKFPILNESSEIITPEVRLFLTHGHIYNALRPPPISKDTILVHGHTHIPVNECMPNGIRVFNPGSISLPKGGNAPTYGILNGDMLEICLL